MLLDNDTLFLGVCWTRSQGSSVRVLMDILMDRRYKTYYLPVTQSLTNYYMSVIENLFYNLFLRGNTINMNMMFYFLHNHNIHVLYVLFHKKVQQQPWPKWIHVSQQH